MIKSFFTKLRSVWLLGNIIKTLNTYLKDEFKIMASDNKIEINTSSAKLLIVVDMTTTIASIMMTDHVRAYRCTTSSRSEFNDEIVYRLLDYDELWNTKLFK